MQILLITGVWVPVKKLDRYPGSFFRKIDSPKCVLPGGVRVDVLGVNRAKEGQMRKKQRQRWEIKFPF